jgi:hypothetical protein
MSIPCPRCVKGTVSGPNGTFWRCHTCRGTGRVDPAPRTWINAERTVLVRQHSGGGVEVSIRTEPDAIWGPAIPVELEHTPETRANR